MIMIMMIVMMMMMMKIIKQYSWSLYNPTNQAREQASRTRPRRNNDVKKIQQQQLPSTRRVQDSP